MIKPDIPNDDTIHALLAYVHAMYDRNLNLVNFSASYYGKLKQGSHIAQEDVDRFQAEIKLFDGFEAAQSEVLQEKIRNIKKKIDLRSIEEAKPTLSKLSDLYLGAMAKAHQLALHFIVSQFKETSQKALTQDTVDKAIALDNVCAETEKRLRTTVQTVLAIVKKSLSSFQLLTEGQLKHTLSQHMESSSKILELFLDFANAKRNLQHLGEDDLNAATFLNMLRYQMYERTFCYMQTVVDWRAQPLPQLSDVKRMAEKLRHLVEQSIKQNTEASNRLNHQQMQYAMKQFDHAAKGITIDLQSGHSQFYARMREFLQQANETAQQLAYL